MKNDYEIILQGNSYDSSDTLFKCKICSNTFRASRHQYSRNLNLCPFCQITAKNVTKEQVEYKLRNKNEEYEILDLRTMQDSTLKHKCGHIIEHANLVRILSRNTKHCINCNHGSIAYTPDYVKNEINTLTNGEYAVLSDYKSEDIPFLIKHEICGHEWNVRRRNFVYKGTRCPRCSKLKTRSKGEEYLKKYFINNSLEPLFEQSFDKCCNKRVLPFDFYFKDLNILIEYDGEMHFHIRRDTDKNKAIEKLRSTHTNDLIKNKYCLNNNIGLLRIPYDIDFVDIKLILDELFETKTISSTTINNLNIYFNLVDKSYENYYNRYSEE